MSGEMRAVDPEMERFRREQARGIELQQEDQADPKRRAIWKQARMVYEASPLGDKQFRDELQTFQHAFLEHVKEPRRYRLYHTIIGSTPPGHADLFDVPGKWSVEKKMKELAKKYKLAPKV